MMDAMVEMMIVAFSAFYTLDYMLDRTDGWRIRVVDICEAKKIGRFQSNHPKSYSSILLYVHLWQWYQHMKAYSHIYLEWKREGNNFEVHRVIYCQHQQAQPLAQK